MESLQKWGLNTPWPRGVIPGFMNHHETTTESVKGRALWGEHQRHLTLTKEDRAGISTSPQRPPGSDTAMRRHQPAGRHSILWPWARIRAQSPRGSCLFCALDLGNKVDPTPHAPQSLLCLHCRNEVQALGSCRLPAQGAVPLSHDMTSRKQESEGCLGPLPPTSQASSTHVGGSPGTVLSALVGPGDTGHRS